MKLGGLGIFGEGKMRYTKSIPSQSDQEVLMEALPRIVRVVHS